MEGSILDASSPQGGAPHINYVDVKLHSIANLPPSFLADSGPAPMFADHPFRYSVEVAVGDSKVALSNGRLLSAIPIYRDYVAGAAIAPTDLHPTDSGRAPAGDVPSDVKRPPQQQAVGGTNNGTAPTPDQGLELKPETPPAGASSPSGGGVVAEEVASAPVQLMWVLSAESDATEWKDADTNQKKDAKPAPKGKGGAAAAATLPTEVVKPVVPQYQGPPPCVARLMLTAAQVEELEAKLEQSLPLTLTFRRTLRSNAPADWEDTQEGRYTATIAVPLSALKEPGARTVSAAVPLVPCATEAPREEEKGKKKAAPKKGKGGVPSILTDEVDPNEAHPYTANGVVATVSLSFSSALTRLPQSRPRPDLQPTDLIPTRLRPPRRPMDATKTFALEVESLTQRIVKEYREHVDSSGGQSGEEARATFLNYLQSSGQAHAYKQLLIPTVQGIVKEKYVRQANPTKEELNKITNELYGYLTDTMHTTIHRVFQSTEQQAKTTRTAIDGLTPSERWKRRAMEAEVMREYGLAAKYHQERLGATKPETIGDESLPNVWAEYAEFSLRVRDALKAEQAFREALAIDYAHLPSLLGYGMLLLSSNRFQEAEVFLQSAVDLQPNTLTWGCLGLFYDMKVLSLPDAPSSAAARQALIREAKYCVTQSTRPVSSSDAPEATDMSPSDAYEHVAKHCIQLYLEDLANLCLIKCQQPSDRVELLYAQVYYQTEQYDEAVTTLKKLVAADATATAPRILYGDVLYAMGDRNEAEQMYNAALRLDAFCGTGPSYVRLGNMCAALGKYRDALAAFISGAKVWPCGLTWLGVGIAYYRMEDLMRAEQALNQSNVLNNLNPKTWAFIALLCLRQRREDEGDQAFNQAIKQGLDDAFLMTEVGVEHLRIGRARVAEMCFRRSLSVQDDVNTHMQLGRALCTMKRFDEARDVFAHVAATSTSDAQRAKAEEQVAIIPTGL